MIYLDASALIKLLLNETESIALTDWLTARADTLRLTSELSRVEVIRVCRRSNEDHIPAARRLISDLDVIPLTSDLLDRAATIGPHTLRSLDAIHLASAMSVGDELSAFVSYDRRLSVAAEEEHLPVFAPS